MGYRAASHNKSKSSLTEFYGTVMRPCSESDDGCQLAPPAVNNQVYFPTPQRKLDSFVNHHPEDDPGTKLLTIYTLHMTHQDKCLILHGRLDTKSLPNLWRINQSENMFPPSTLNSRFEKACLSYFVFCIHFIYLDIMSRISCLIFDDYWLLTIALPITPWQTQPRRLSFVSR